MQKAHKTLLWVLAALGILSGAVAHAQTTVGPPFFPQTLPSGTLVGRISAGTGPSQAVPFTSLQQLAIGNIAVGTTPVVGGNPNDLLMVTGGNVLGQVTAAANCIYLTNGSSVPSCGTSLANTFTIAAPTNANALAISGYSLTGANAQAMLNYSGQVNTSGSPDIVHVAITDTAHGGSTKFINLLGGSGGTTSLFSVDMSGNLVFAGTCTGCGGGITANTTVTSGFTAGQIPYSDGSKIQAANLFYSSNFLELRNSTTAQENCVYNTYASSTSYERFCVDWNLNANVATVGTNHGSGGGSARQLWLVSDTNPGYLIQSAAKAMAWDTAGIYVNSNGGLAWSSSTSDPYASTKAFFNSPSQNVVQLGSNGGTNASGDFGARTYYVGGSAPTFTGTCTAPTSQAGGNTAGTWTVAGAGACSGGTYILTFGYTATNGWACQASDRSTPADTVKQTASSQTTATFTATTANNDVVSFSCTAY